MKIYLKNRSALKKFSRGWRDGLVVKSTCCSCRRPGFCSQYPREVSRPSVTSFFRGFDSDLCCTRHVHAHTDVQAKHSYIVFVNSTVATVRCCEQKQIEEERPTSLTLSPLGPSLEKVSTRTQAGQEPGGRSWSTGHGGELLTGLLTMTCSVYFLIEPRTTNSGTGLPTMGLSLIKEIP